MVSNTQPETAIIRPVQSVIEWSAKLLKDAPLTETQREDFVAINTSARRFLEYAQEKIDLIRNGTSPEEAQRIRHDLRNHLNIINGFSRLFVKQLPDNLLLHMMQIRQIHATSQKLIEQVDNIR